VDAPAGVRRIFESERRVGWVLTSVRPLAGGAIHLPRARMGVRGSGSNQNRVLEARCRKLVFPIPSRQPLRHTLLPTILHLRRPHDRARVILRRRDRSSVDPALRQQCPVDPRCLVSRCHRYQHPRLACRHSGEPRSRRSASHTGLAHDSACSDDEEAPYGSLAHPRGFAETLFLPAEALDERLAIVGTSGSGKTYAAKGLVEHLLEASARVCVVDPLGVWWACAPARMATPGYPVVVFGGRHAEPYYIAKASQLLRAA
jgi:Helicase HerA, central domain